jgi:hypothetical protein
MAEAGKLVITLSRDTLALNIAFGLTGRTGRLKKHQRHANARGR